MKHRYGSIDGLRVIACIGIVMMHKAIKSNFNCIPKNNLLISGL